MVTIYDVAKKAGVSPATVSRVLNGKANVNPKTKEKVRKICEELNYVPNANAGSLKKKETKTLALIIPDIPNPFFISIVNGFENRAIESGYNTILCNTNQNYEKEADYIDMILEKRIDGVAISTVSKDSTHIKKILKQEVPFLLIDRSMEDLEEFNIDIICGDSYEGSIELVNFLIKKGYKNIAMISAPLHLSTSRDRVKGYKKALKDNNIKFDDEILKIDNKYEGFSKETAYELTQDLLAKEKDIDAIFVANNLMALGTYKALKERSIKIPQEIALVCFDEVSQFPELEEFFTVMKQPANTMGDMAANTLIKKIEDSYEGHSQKIVLKPKLIERNSA